MSNLVQATFPDGDLRTDAYGMPIYVETPRIPPPGRVEGALVRKSAPGTDGEIFRDAFRKQIIDPSDWPSLIEAGAGDHREYVNWIYDQDGIGSCAAEGLCGCVDAQRERRGLTPVKFNPWPLYYYASGGRDIGSSLDANIREAKSRGMVPDELWPRSQHRWDDLPPASVWAEAAKYKPDEIYDIGNAVEAVSALFLGHSVYAAYPGHAWQLIAPVNTQQALWRNSWSVSWDGDGIGVINLDRLTYQYGLFAVQTTSADA